MISGYPEYVQHCLLPNIPGDPLKSWCGSTVPSTERAIFISATQALASRGSEKRLCPDCGEAMKGEIAAVCYKRSLMSPMDRTERTDRERHPDGIPYYPGMDLPPRPSGDDG